MNATGAGGGPVFVAPNLNKSATPASLPGPVNLTALGQDVPSSGPANASGSGSGSAPAPTGGSGSDATSNVVSSFAVAVVAAVGAVFML